MNVLLGLDAFWEGCGQQVIDPEAQYCADVWNSLVCKERFADLVLLDPLMDDSIATGACGHMGLGQAYPAVKGRVVSMFRQPEQRTVSAYKFYFMGWPYDRVP